MASFADLRPIIVISVFLSLFILFTAMVAGSPEIWGGTAETQRINARSDLNVWNIVYWNMTNGTVIDWTGSAPNSWTHTAMFGQIQVKIYVYNRSWTQEALQSPIIQIDSYRNGPLDLYEDLGSFEHFNWYHMNDTYMIQEIGTDAQVTAINTAHGISIAQLITDCGSMQGEQNLAGMTYYITNTRCSQTVTFLYNTSAFFSPLSAFLANDLYISFGQGYAETQSGLNVLSLIGGLMFWSLPNVPTYIYLLFSFIIYPPIVYVLAIWILRIIGSVAGGGASG